MFDHSKTYLAGHSLAGIGAVNWGLVQFADLNLVTTLLGTNTLPTAAVYGLVALGGVQVLGDAVTDYMEGEI
ncbi:MAG: DUF378 domain-containing protein [Candidatus Nanohaloarchaea archaeon]